MRKFVTIAGLALAAATLGGCQSITGSGSADAGQVDMGEYFAQRLAVGRIHLEAGRPTKAITAFRQASYDPRFAAEAYNGMAVAYDRIGRADLASTYFTKAMEADPADERFARNLARLEGREYVPLPIMREAEPAQLAVTETAAPDVRGPVTIQPRNEELRGPVRVEKAPEVKLARRSQGQVSIGADEPSNVVRMVKRVEAPVKLVVETRSAERVVQRVRRNAQARRGYPIRIVLNDTGSKRN